MSEIDRQIRRAQVPSEDRRMQIPRRDQTPAPAAGRVFLTGRSQGSGAQGQVMTGGSRSGQTNARLDVSQDYSGHRQAHMETQGGCSALGTRSAVSGIVRLDMYEFIDWRISLSGDATIVLACGGDDDDGARRGNALIERAFWLRVKVVHNGFRVSFNEAVEWDAEDGEPEQDPKPDGRYIYTFTADHFLDVDGETFTEFAHTGFRQVVPQGTTGA